MKTDKETIVNESLEDAANNDYPIGKDAPISSRARAEYNAFKESFINGANWQKEQLLPLLNELVESLKIVTKQFKTVEKLYTKDRMAIEIGESAIEKANQLTNK